MAQDTHAMKDHFKNAYRAEDRHSAVMASHEHLKAYALAHPETTYLVADAISQVLTAAAAHESS